MSQSRKSLYREFSAITQRNELLTHDRIIHTTTKMANYLKQRDCKLITTTMRTKIPFNSLPIRNITTPYISKIPNQHCSLERLEYLVKAEISKDLNYKF